MPPPIDYSSQVADPFAAALQGLQFGSGLADFQQQRQAQQVALQQKQQQTEAVNALISNPNPTAADYARATIALPNLKDQLKQSWELHSEEQKKSSLSEITEVYSALQSGRPQIAADILNRRADALENSGGPEDQIDAARRMARMAVEAPDFARTQTGLQLASIPGGDKIIEGASKLSETYRKETLLSSDIKKAAADLGLTEAQSVKALVDAKKGMAEIAKTNVEAGKIASEAAIKTLELQKKREGIIELDAPAKKLINEAVTDAANLNSLSAQYNALADALTADIQSGIVGKAEESKKRFFGSEEKITRLRQEYKRLRNSQVLQTLPPGVASDKDIEIAMEAFPDATANPALIASFLRGVSKLQDYDSSLNEAKAEWVNANGSLGKSRKDVEILGQSFSAGTNFNDALSTVLYPASAIEADTDGSEIDALLKKYGAK